MTRLHSAFKLTPLAALACCRRGIRHQWLLPARLRHQGQGHGRRRRWRWPTTAWAAPTTRRAWCWPARGWTSVSTGSRRSVKPSAPMPSTSHRSTATSTSDSTNFFVPEFGYNAMVGSNMSLGVTVYGNGGMNTNYPQGPFMCPTGPESAAPANMLCGNGALGIDLMQLIVAPTLAYKVNDTAFDRRVAAGGLPAVQGLRPAGVRQPLTSRRAPGSVTNNGYVAIASASASASATWAGSATSSASACR